jgi:hypothetical protein
MGSSAEISIGKYKYLYSQSYLTPLLLIFNSWDKQIESCIEDDESPSYKYITTVKQAKQCLDVSGHRITEAKNIFESSKADLEWFFDTTYDDKMDEALRKYQFENWYSSVIYFSKKLSSEGYPWIDNDDAWFNNIDKDDVSNYMIARSLPFDSGFFWGLPRENVNEWTIFRVILEAFNDNENIVLDYSALVSGGYCDAMQDTNDFIFDKVLILTEGITDSEFISRSLNILYPHLSKFFSFMDFGIMKVHGGVSFLAHYIKAFAGAKINNMIIGLFDNDSAAIDELKNLEEICLPNNIRILKLPEIEIGKNYPTIGPTKNHNIDINGLACSIELFFGKDILQQGDGTLTPIMWTGYKERICQYQGEILNKEKLHKKYRQKLEFAEKTHQINKVEWEDMIILIEKLIYAFD